MPTTCPHPAHELALHCDTPDCPWTICTLCTQASRDRGKTWITRTVVRANGHYVIGAS